MLLAIGVIIVLMTTALPALTQMFKEFNGQLPITTRILIGLTFSTASHAHPRERRAGGSAPPGCSASPSASGSSTA